MRPLEAFGVAEQVQPVDRQLRVFGQADDVVAQAATVGSSQVSGGSENWVASERGDDQVY
ncbi:hypothetical protein [Leptolyngbya sp. O-77]|uniref:hypothetical protein n=1 Tax=Leptolyngbya sp. O-77 TaxID=1080068 RepID=UPI001CEDF79B|nr:hypothetical protein [Leptolyngbya sp. O-77]